MISNSIRKAPYVRLRGSVAIEATSKLATTNRSNKNEAEENLGLARPTRKRARGPLARRPVGRSVRSVGRYFGYVCR